MMISNFSGCTATKSIDEERIVSADRLIKRIEANRRKVKTFVGSGTIAIKNKEMDTKSNFQVEIIKPDSIKVSFFGPFGIDLAYALINNNSFQFYDVINNQIYRGKLHSGIIKDILKINIEYEELIDALTGGVDLSSRLREMPEIYNRGSDIFEITFVDSIADKKDILKIRSDNFVITQQQIAKINGKVFYEANYGGFRKIDEVSVPYQLSIDDKANEQKIKIDYRKIEINKKVDKLKIEIPEDAKIIDL